MPNVSDAAETLHIDGKLAITRTATSDDTTGGHRWCCCIASVARSTTGIQHSSTHWQPIFAS
jgi:hypothetical protein